MNPPKLLLMLSEIWTMANPRDLPSVVSLAKVAEDAGFDGIMLSEHVLLGSSASNLGLPLNPREFAGPGNQEPTHPWPSSLLQFAAMASQTTRIEFYAAAVLTPLRHPLVIAKDLATLDLLSEGRLTVMPSVSWHEDEYRALGVAFHERGRILDEQLEIFDLVWSNSPASYEGRYFEFQNVYLEPKPFRPRGPKLWFGGSSIHDALLKRLVRYGCGFLPLKPISPADRERIAEAMALGGREMDELEFPAALTLPFASAEGSISLEAALEAIVPRLAAGATALLVKPSQFVDNPAHVADLCDRIVAALSEL